MMCLVAVAQTAQHLDRVFNAGLFNVDWSKASFKRRVLFDVFVIFVAGCGADTLQVAPCQGWLEHIRGVHGTLCCPCSDHGVQFIDEQNHFPIGLLDLFNGVLEALLEFSTEACSGNHGSKIERDYQFVR